MTKKSKISNPLQKALTGFMLLKLAATYLEPGSSSFLLKILISSLVAFVVFFRQIWSYLRAVVSKLRGKRMKTVGQTTAVADQSSQNEIQ